MQSCHLSFTGVAKALPWVYKILTGYSLSCAHFPAPNTVRNWMLDWYKERFRTTTFASIKTSMHLAGDDATMHGRNLHILHASYYDPDRHRPVTKQIGNEDVTGGGTAAALVALEAMLILRFSLSPERVVTYTSDHAPVMVGTENGVVVLLSKICGHKILSIGCALHANSLELKYFLNAIKLPVDDNLAPGAQEMTSTMQLVKLFNQLHSVMSWRLPWYREQAHVLCGWTLTLIPVALLTRWPTVANAVSWVVGNRQRIVEFVRALYADNGPGIQGHREVWSSLAAALTNSRCMCILLVMHDFCQMWTLPNYRWFLSPSETTGCPVLFRSAECPRKVAYMLLSLGSVSAQPNEDHLRPYAKLSAYLAQLDSNGSLGNVRAQVAACLGSAHRCTLNAVERFMVRTWLNSPAVFFALGDPESAAGVVRAAAYVHAREAHRWTALSSVDNHYTRSQLDVMEQHYDTFSVERLYTEIASAHGTSQLMINEMDDFYVEILFMTCLQRKAGVINSLLDTAFSILADQSCADCFADIADHGHSHFEGHPECRVQKWIFDVVYPTPHTNIGVEGAFARAKRSLHPNMALSTVQATMSATSVVHDLPQRGRSKEDIVAHILVALSPNSSHSEPSQSIQELQDCSNDVEIYDLAADE